MVKLDEAFAYLFEQEKDFEERYFKATGLSPWQEEEGGSKTKIVKIKRFYDDEKK